MRPPDPVVLREALRQGERILAMQDETREAVLRRTGDLLRLAIATIAGVLVLGGILTTTGVWVPIWVFVAMVTSVGLQVASAGILASILAGGRSVGMFIYGPDLRLIAAHLQEDAASETGLLIALTDAQPDWVDLNKELLVRLQRSNGLALLLLSLGTLFLLLCLIFITGGAIYA